MSTCAAWRRLAPEYSVSHRRTCTCWASILNRQRQWPALRRRSVISKRNEIERYGRPIFLIGLTRAGKAIKSTPDTKIERWDVLTVCGVRAHVEDLIKVLGSANRARFKSDIAYMGAGIVIGGLIGAITIHVGGVPLGLSTRASIRQSGCTILLL